MLSLLDRGTRLCDGLTRRELMRLGGLSTLGMSLSALLRAAEGPPPGIIEDPTFGRAKNVIYVWLQGGPPQHETFDPKPDAPLEIRGPFRPIQTNIPGIHFCELLPRTACLVDKLAVIRSLSTDDNIHSSSAHEVLTGYKYTGPNPRTISPTDWPYFGSLVKMLKPSETLPPLSTVWIPRKMFLNENVTPAGQTAGFLGQQWDPDCFLGDPSDPRYEVEGLRTTDVTPLRLTRRMSLLDQVDGHFRQLERGRTVAVYDQFQQQAFDLLTSGRVRKAFAVREEPDRLRDRYGRHKWGQCLLLARRLIEAGVRLVHVNWTREPGDSAVDNPMWDTHAQNADRMEDVLAPMFDVGFTALIEDLDQRGLLDETLVIAIGEFGRTPKINSIGGRDHWGPVFSFLMAGAGVTTGQVYGASDKNGGYPARDRMTPADLTATLFHLLGIPHSGTFLDAQKREHRLTMGEPVRALLGGGVATYKRTRSDGDIARVPPYNDDLLLNTDFQAPVPLRPFDHGSRPKGWRAGPLAQQDGTATFGVVLVKPDRSPLGTEKQHVAIGVGLPGLKGPVTIEQGNEAVLAQEMRSPRAGRFLFRIRACGRAATKESYDELFLQHFTARLVIFRYRENDKNPTRREELASEEFQPPFDADPGSGHAEFTLSATLDSPTPNVNFSTGHGLGVAIVVTKTSADSLHLPAAENAQPVSIEIARAEVHFNSRTINEDVTV